ncbi:MAG: hypothetical protein ACOYVF_04775 [Candidatus Zixiibacteriota bacterium]
MSSCKTLPIFIILLLIAVPVLADTPLDYLPLEVGLEWHYHTDTSIHSQWGQRSVKWQIPGIDEIEGEEYFRLTIKEKMDYEAEYSPNNAIWFNSDPDSNIIIKAFTTDSLSDDIDSALILDNPVIFFSRGMLDLGNTWSYCIEELDFCENIEVTGVGEQITVPVGTFENCLVHKSVMTNLAGTDTASISYFWYAYGIGRVMDERVYPETSHHQLELISLGCCEGTTGNVNCSEYEDPDISDITRLIDFLYLSHIPLCCLEEADCNGSGGEPDISDITKLIDFLYLSHSQLSACM